MKVIPDDVKKQLEDFKQSLQKEFEKIKSDFSNDLVIDENKIDEALLSIPNLQAKWSAKLSDEILILKDLYSFKKSVELERWKYYSGKQSDRYIAENGIIHEKILKTDLDKYLSCDVKNVKVNELVSLQKEKVDFIERGLKEITNRGFHVRSIIDWRKFISGN